MNTKHGFTIVELLIVIVVIGILAAITIVAFNGIQDRARMQKMQSDLSTLERAIKAAQINTDSHLVVIAGKTGTAYECTLHATDLASLPETDPCWTDYFDTLERISTQSGVNVRQLIDPWKRPYLIDENETPTNCIQDTISAFSRPVNNWDSLPGTLRRIPFVTTACS